VSAAPVGPGATGRLFGVGVGPGDPDLMTVRAVDLVRGADVVAYHCARHGRSNARAIAAAHLGTQIEEALTYPVTTETVGGPEDYQARLDGFYADVAARLAEHLDAGRDVVVLSEGDPFFYGSFLYLHARLGTRFPAVVVPGVSSVMASAASARRPLSARGDILTVLPATLPDDRLRAAILGADSLAILKLGRHFARVKRLLAELGLTDRAIYAERVTQGGERVLPLAETGDTAPYFATLLVYRGTEPAILGTLA